MKASFPPFASCFPPWSCCARPALICDQRATGGGRWPGPLPVLFNRLLRHTQVLCYFPCTPRATALRQARVSGGNLQNCAPSAACGGAMTQESTVLPFPPFSPAYALCCFSMPSLSAISAMNSPLVGLSSGTATRQPNARFSDSTRPRLQATSMAWRMARSTLLGLVA